MSGNSEKFFKPEAGIVAAQYLAPFIVKQAKKYVRGCGGDTHVARIPKNKPPTYMRDADVAIGEKYFEKLFSQAAHLAYMGLYPSSHRRMDLHIDQFKEAVRKLRVRVHKGEPLGEQLHRAFGAKYVEAESKGDPKALRVRKSPKRDR
jgi:hypothetical protein